VGLFDKIVSFFEEKEEEIPRLGRNDPCWCGSGKKYKRCHLEQDEKKRSQRRASTCRTN